MVRCFEIVGLLSVSPRLKPSLTAGEPHQEKSVLEKVALFFTNSHYAERSLSCASPRRILLRMKAAGATLLEVSNYELLSLVTKACINLHFGL